MSCGLPLLALLLIPWMTRRPIREAWVIFGYSQGGPVWLIYSILLTGVACGVVGVLRLPG